MTEPAASEPDPRDDERPAGFVGALAAYLDGMTPAERARLEHAERMDGECAGLPIDEATELERAALEPAR
ncbi:MAG: hypothetical protein KF729_36945 [Sandaracinaceae bacterium]|nr:hypothetical protein [Sandaracinaceae bacterium]